MTKDLSDHKVKLDQRVTQVFQVLKVIQVKLDQQV